MIKHTPGRARPYAARKNKRERWRHFVTENAAKVYLAKRPGVFKLYHVNCGEIIQTTPFVAPNIQGARNMAPLYFGSMPGKVYAVRQRDI